MLYSVICEWTVIRVLPIYWSGVVVFIFIVAVAVAADDDDDDGFSGGGTYFEIGDFLSILLLSLYLRTQNNMSAVIIILWL